MNRQRYRREVENKVENIKGKLCITVKSDSEEKTDIGRNTEGIRRELKKIVLCGYTCRISQAYEQRHWRRTGDKATLQMLAECRK